MFVDPLLVAIDLAEEYLLSVSRPQICEKMAVTQAGAQLERCHQVPLDREIAVQICLADALFIERRECRDGLRVFDANPEFDGALADTLRLTCVVELESGFRWKRSRERVQDALHLAGR